MGVETGTTIAQLDVLWPLGGDPASQGDDHLRLIKSVLKTQFPGLLGNGFAIPLTVNEYELNYLDGATENVQAAINGLRAANATALINLYAPVNTMMFFYQAAAPTGWVQEVALNDYMLRIVAVAGGTAGGVDSPIYKQLTHTHTTDITVLTLAQIPSHSHRAQTGVGTYYPLNNNVTNLPGGGFGGGTPDDNWATYDTGSAGSGNGHNHGVSTSAPVFHPKYMNTIMCRKT